MADGPSKPQHDWVIAVLGVDPGKYGADGAKASEPGAASSGEAGVLDTFGKKLTYAATTVENAAGDVWSNLKIGAENVEQSMEGGLDTLVEKAGDGVEAAQNLVTPKPPGPPPPTAPITLASQTEAASPSNRTRTKLGVGERVTLTVKPGPGQWHSSGNATLSAKSGSRITMTAPSRPGNVEITVTVGAQVKTLKFTVVAPTEVHQVTLSVEHKSNGLPNAGFKAQVYLGPDDVNFGAVSFVEDEIGAKTTGSWTAKNGEGHSPNPKPIASTFQVVPGKGTQSLGQDHCWTGYIPGLRLTDWTGTMTLSIPWHWQCGSGKGLIDRVIQKVVTTADGTTTISKAGASNTAALS